MVNIDAVYQKVLALANKEQRGYITPQEFNLFADQAQKEIFEQYFYDLDQRLRAPSNSEEYSDIISNLREKIMLFEAFTSIVNGSPAIPAGAVFYRLGTVITSQGEKIEEVQPNENAYILNSPLLSPSEKRPTFVRFDAGFGNGPINITPSTSAIGALCYYTRMPTTPSWGYFVVGDRALYDPNPTKTTDFELHPSEETELVYKILTFAGIAMKKDDIAKSGSGLNLSQIQQEKQ
tara:strand:- start:1167 stop:1871 length:705 start_codon:yes stop_codon:yes gene_type:complete